MNYLDAFVDEKIRKLYLILQYAICGLNQSLTPHFCGNVG